MKPPTVTCPARTHGNAYTSLPLSMGSPMPPTSWRSSSCDGEGMGMGLVGTETERGASLVVLARCWFPGALVLMILISEH